MTAGNHARVGSRVFAIIWLGLLTQVAFAEDSGAGGRQGGATSNVSAAPSGSQTLPAGNAVSETAAKNTDAIDTRISVQTRRPGNKSGKAGEVTAKFSLPGVKNPHRRVFSASGASNRTVRNAVSVPVNQHDLSDRQVGAHPLIVPAQHLPAGQIGVVGSTALGIAKSDSGVVRQIIVPPRASPTTPNRGIGGTTAMHRGVSAVSIGGPARTATGLDGATIRPAH